MIGSLSSRVPGLLAVAAVALLASLTTGKPELAVLVLPLLIYVGIGLVLAQEPRLTGAIGLERDRLLEGDRVTVTVTLENEGEGGVELELALARTRQLALEPPGPVLVRLGAGQRLALEFRARPVRWGAYQVGPVVLRARDPLALAPWHGRLGHQLSLRVFPREQRLRELVGPLRTQPSLGAHVARLRGEGTEFAEIRRFTVGDRVRRINWRTTARRGSLYVTDKHPEHTSDVVLLLDTFAEARDGADGTLDAAVRAAASLARAHLGRRDRVALVDFGGTLHWLEPGLGTTQLYRIIDALLASQIAFSYPWRAVTSIPRRVLPSGALLLAITPLLDERSVQLVTELRTRGADLVVVEVSPLGHTRPAPTTAGALAYRLWRLQREALRTRLQGLGIAVAVWEDDDTLSPALEGVNAFRRSARRMSRA